MAFEEEKKAEAADGKSAAAAKSKPLGKLGLPVLVALLVVGGSAGGAVLGPVIASRGHANAAASSEGGEKREHEKEKAEEEAPAGVAALDAIVVDLREKEGDIHHLKVGIAVELAKPIPEEEFKRYTPRVRDMVIGYLRSLKFEEVTDPSKYDGIRGEISERVSHALGKSVVRRVLLTDFVAQ